MVVYLDGGDTGSCSLSTLIIGTLGVVVCTVFMCLDHRDSGSCSFYCVCALIIGTLGVVVFTYLDDGDSGLEAGRQLVQDLGQELLVLQDLPHLHDPHYGSLHTHAHTHTHQITVNPD